VDKFIAGPDEEKRSHSKTYLWGEVINKRGEKVTKYNQG
jgi:hypothetical protein